MRSRLSWEHISSTISLGALAALRRFDHQAVYGGRLQRLAVPGFPEANRMETDLDMGGNAITGAGRLSAASLALSGDLEAGGDITELSS